MTEINDVEYIYINHSVWTTTPAAGYLAGNQSMNRQRTLTLRGDVMPASDFNDLRALDGQLVNVKTCGYDTDNEVTYYGVVVTSVAGIHDGPNFTNVTVSINVADV